MGSEERLCVGPPGGGGERGLLLWGGGTLQSFCGYLRAAFGLGGVSTIAGIQENRAEPHVGFPKGTLKQLSWTLYACLLVLNGFLLGTLGYCHGPYSRTGQDASVEYTPSLSNNHGTRSHAGNPVRTGKTPGGDKSNIHSCSKHWAGSPPPRETRWSPEFMEPD